MFYENVIIGGGPAGIQMAYYLHKANASYIVIEKNAKAGTFFDTYPRNRRLISVNKKFCGDTNNIENVRRYDWNSLLTLQEDDFKCMFGDYTEEYYPDPSKLVEYLNDFVAMYSLNISYNAAVFNVSFNNETSEFVIGLASNDQIRCKKVFVASGLLPNHMIETFKVPDFSSECSNFFFYDTYPKNPEFFKNKSVLIIGGGNAAFETLNYVNNYCKDFTLYGAERFAYNTHYPGNIRSINMPVLDSYYLKLLGNISWSRSSFARDDSRIAELFPDILDGSIFDQYDIVICCTGFKPNLSMFDTSVRINKSERGFPITTPFYESTSCPSLYFIGSLSQEHDYKKGTSAFIHGFRYNCKVLYEHLFSQPKTFEIQQTISVAHKLLHQINHSSILFHRFDYIADYIFVHHDSWTYVCGLPLYLVNNKAFDIHRYTSKPSLYIVQVYLGYNKNVSFKKSFLQPQTGSSLSVRDESVFLHPHINVFTYHDTQWKHEYTLRLPEQAFNKFDSTEQHVNIVTQFFHLIDDHKNDGDLLHTEHFQAMDFMFNMRN